jgi:hypothetical protein
MVIDITGVYLLVSRGGKHSNLCVIGQAASTDSPLIPLTHGLWKIPFDSQITLAGIDTPRDGDIASAMGFSG